MRLQKAKTIFKFFCTLFFLFLIFSCKNEIKNKTITLNSIPDRITKNTILTYKDSGKVVFTLESRLIKEYERIDSPYTIFPKGFVLNFYDKKNDKGKVLSDWAKWSKIKNLYELREDVIVVNKDNDSLKTDTLYWDKERRLIFTRDTVTIIRADGTTITATNGMESSEDFKEYTFSNNSGEFYLKNQEL